MRLRRDSLLIKIIFYNDIAIVLTSLMIATILILITFKDMEDSQKRITREKTILLERFYDYYIEEVEGDIDQVTNGGYVKSTLEEYPGIRNNYPLLASQVRSSLTKKSYEKFKNIVVSIVGKDGSVLGESGDRQGLTTLSLTGSQTYLDYLKGDDYIPSLPYREVVGDRIAIRIAVKNTDVKNDIDKIIVSFNIRDSFITNSKELIALGEESQIFHLYGNGEVRSKGILGAGSYNTKLSLNRFKGDYFFGEIMISKERYSIGIVPVKSMDDEIIGGIGIAISKTEMSRMKAIILLLIISTCIGLILVNSAIFGKIFYNMLNPLVEIADLSNKIAKGEKGTELRVSGSGEVRTLVKSFKRMVSTIEKNEEDLRDKNDKLHENLSRIDVIEKLLLRIYGKDDIFEVINIIIQAMVSEVGLGYSRGIFLRYSREVESLVGEYAIVNNKIVIDSQGEKDVVGGFRIQNGPLNDILSYIKISVRKESLLSDALLQKRIIYYNDKSYKYNLGNELLQSLGLENFIIIPIYGTEREYGCIILDNFTKKRVITPEEVELINLLILNLGTHFKNRSLEEEKLENERSLTIGKLSEKFLGGREKLLSKVSDLIEEAKVNPKKVASKLVALEEELSKIKREDSILGEYSDIKVYNKQVFQLDDLLNDIYIESKNEIRSKGISISLFIKYSGMVYGDRVELKKSILEVLSNAVDAVMASTNVAKKINIIMSKGRNTEKIRVRIVDNGIGMNELQLQSIEEPFVSYKKDSAGLGLSIAFRIIKHHRGIAKVISKVGNGTEVKITLNDYKEEIK